MASMKAVMSLVTLTAAAMASPMVNIKTRQDTSAPFLNSEAVAKGKLWFGSAIDTGSAEVSNSEYMTVFNDS